MTEGPKDGGRRQPADRERVDKVVALPLSPEARLVLTALRRLLRGRGALVPHHHDVLRYLWPVELPAPPRDLTTPTEALIHRGLLRRVIVGREPHLMLAGRGAQSGRRSEPAIAEVGDGERVEQGADSDHAVSSGQVSDPLATPEQDAASSTNTLPERGNAGPDAGAFELQLAVDTETERVLLYRVAVVMLVLAALTIAREWALFLYHL